MAETQNGRPWDVLTNHAYVLLAVAQNPKALTREIARQVGITERAVYRILSDLIGAGYVSTHRNPHNARCSVYTVHEDAPLGRPRRARVRDLLVLGAAHERTEVTG